MKRSCLGKRYGKLVVIEAMWPKLKCKCDCGNEKIVHAPGLYSGDTKSCGCLLRKQGGLTTKNRPEYNAWVGMKNRCFNKSNIDVYPNYGGRGITVCGRWINSFPNFLHDMGVKPSKKHTLDRINNDGNYDPSNCRWSTMTEQQNNKRNNVLIEYLGELKTLPQWAKLFDLNKKTLGARIYRLNWTINKALNTPARKKL